jgi:hypothetical protein
MRRSLAIPAAAGLVTCLLTLGGIAVSRELRTTEPARVLSQQTLADVKVDVKAIEAEIAALVPESVRTEIRKKSGGVIMNCAPGGVSWGSSTRVVLSGEPDLVRLRDDLEREWPRAAEFEFTSTTGSTDEPRLIIDSDRLGSYIIDPYGHELQILSFSTCFAYDPERDGYAWEIAAE